jgi:predicted Rossmann fold nucleotide-binding protein DprA/Smf involved in DNA uptake
MPDTTFHAQVMGDFTIVDRKPHVDVPKRVCSFCKAVLSRYNPGQCCWPCESAALKGVPTVAPSLVSHPNRAPAYRPKTYQAFLRVLESVSDDFKAQDIASVMSISASALSRQLLYAEEDGFIVRQNRVKLPRNNGHWGGWVTIWRRTA